jgi:hypothetical protein
VYWIKNLKKRPRSTRAVAPRKDRSTLSFIYIRPEEDVLGSASCYAGYAKERRYRHQFIAAVTRIEEVGWANLNVNITVAADKETTGGRRISDVTTDETCWQLHCCTNTEHVGGETSKKLATMKKLK